MVVGSWGAALRPALTLRQTGWSAARLLEICPPVMRQSQGLRCTPPRACATGLAMPTAREDEDEISREDTMPFRLSARVASICFFVATITWTVPSWAGKLVITAQDGHWASVDGDYQAANLIVPDNLVVVDSSVFPPKKIGETEIEHSVIAPPMAIALSPDEKLALVAAPKRLDPGNNKKLIEDTFIQVIDLTTSPIKVIDRVDLKSYPMGVSFNKAGTLALVAHPNKGTVSVLSIHGKQVKLIDTVTLGDAQTRVSTVAFAPDGKWALATKRGKGTVAVLKVDGMKVIYTKRDVTVGIQPYGLEIFPNGRLAAICVHGNEDGDNDEIALIDLMREPFRTIEHVSVGQTPKGVAISPDNKRMAVSVIEGTNLPKKTSPVHFGRNTAHCSCFQSTAHTP